MLAKFHISATGGWTNGWITFIRDFPPDARREFETLPSGSDYIGWLQHRLDDNRFRGHCVVWEPV